MTANRILLLPLLACVALTGCQIRKSDTVVAREVGSDNAALANKVDRLERDNQELRNKLAIVNADLEASKANSSLGATLKRLDKNPAPEGTSHTESGGLALSEDFAFAKGSADLNEGGKKTIEKIAVLLNEGENTMSKVIVEGHTDDTPVARASTKEKFGDNWGLSAARAAAVVRALESHKVDAKRFIGRFRGEYAPRVVEGDKAKNRRVEIYLGE
jgi:chemotaxis protein MotB